LANADEIELVFVAIVVIEWQDVRKIPLRVLMLWLIIPLLGG
jgi:hypothetical protein